MQSISTLFVLLFLGTASAVFAQPSAANLTSDITGTELFTPAPVAEDDWTLYVDEDNKLFYIDFETLQVNVSDVLVKNEKGDLVWKDNVFNLPVNTIYEMDFSRFQSGVYEIELRTFTGSIRKKLTIH
jgi:hypothetical protein